jgi:hypothetical protein
VTALNRESKAKKGLLSKNDQIQVSNKAGDVLLASAVRSVGTAAKDACNVILADFAVHGHAKPSGVATPAPEPAAPSTQTPQSTAVPSGVPATEIAISSTPDGADIEIDGNFLLGTLHQHSAWRRAITS